MTSRERFSCRLLEQLSESPCDCPCSMFERRPRLRFVLAMLCVMPSYTSCPLVHALRAIHKRAHIPGSSSLCLCLGLCLCLCSVSLSLSLSASLSLSLSFSRSCAWKPRWCCRSGFRRSRRAGPFHANRIRPVHTKGLMRAVLSGVRLAGNRPAVPQAGDAGSTFE